VVSGGSLGDVLRASCCGVPVVLLPFFGHSLLLSIPQTVCSYGNSYNLVLIHRG